MMLKTQRRSNSATVLIAVLSILAVLSLLAATFGMVMLVELGASKNQTEHEMAREAANAGYQYLMRVIKDNPASLADGTMPDDLCPDPSNCFFCQELYTQKGVKVGFVLHEYDATHHGAASTSWPRGVGMTNSGMFNINCMGSAADMGDPAYVGGNRYSSFEASLMRLLESRFADVTDADMTPYFGAGVWPGHRTRMARYIASAIINRRYGADGLPGTRGFETGRHEHLPAWFRATPYWAATGIPSGGEDTGAAASGVFWGEVDSVAGGGPYTITVDVNGPGWIDWPTNRWDAGYEVYFASGANVIGQRADITTTTTPNTLVLANTLTGAPVQGDEFCIIPTGADIGDGDLAPTALTWPNGVLATETYIEPLFLRKGTILEDAFLTTQLTLDKDVPMSWLGCIIRIMEGPLRGQARYITPNSINPKIVAISPELPSLAALVDDLSGSVIGGAIDRLDVAGTPLGIDEYKGKVIEFTDNSAGPTVESRVIISNTANEVYIDAGDPFSAIPAVGDTYRIRHLNYQIERDYLDARTVDAVPNPNEVRAAGVPGWTPNMWVGCVCNVYSSAVASELGQTRLIIGNDNDTLTLDRDWNDAPDSAGALFRIELPQDAKYRPDDLRGDDLAYRSVPEIIPVIVEALDHDPASPFLPADTGTVAAILYNAIKDDLTVSSGLKKEECAGINDWFLDGIDNDDNGVVDDEDLDLAVSADLETLATNLYNNLGLRDWAHESDPSTRVIQAAQIIANIIDFRDDDHVPTVLTDSDIQDDVVGAFTVYGAEGLHITEVMTMPAEITSADGTEILLDGGPGGTDDPLTPDPAGDDDDGDIHWLGGQGDQDGWDWDPVNSCWYVYDQTDAANRITGSWTFSGLRDGWYAIRLHGAQDDFFDFVHAGRAGTVTTYRDDGTGAYWGYVEDNLAVGKLMAVQVVGGLLSFDLTADQNVEFHGFQLLPQYIEITNIAANDIHLGGHELNIDTASGTQTLNLPSEAFVWGASADGDFPINYGTYVIAMSERAYDQQWGANPSGSWGDSAGGGEDYPVFFAGDVDDATADWLLSLSPAATSRLTLENRSNVVMAGGDIDGDMGIATATDYVAREKDASVLSKADWVDYHATPTVLCGSQNKQESGGLYTGLNRSFSALWQTYLETGAPTFNASATLVGNSEVLPIILNRPYASPGWLGLVPLGNIDTFEWRTIDPDPNTDGNDTPEEPVELLGTLMTRALVGGVHARINLNNPSEEMRLHSLKSIFDDATATSLSQDTPAGWRPVGGWVNWDQMLTDANLQSIADVASQEDSGAGTYADDFPDDSDELEEWARRYSNLIDLQTTNFRYTIAGLAYDAMAKDNSEPVAEVRIEIELDISDSSNPQVVNYRYATE